MTDTEIPEDITKIAWDCLGDYYEPDLHSKIEAALLAERRRHTVEAQPVPEDWQLVPTEITTDMMGAFHHAKRVEKFVPDIWSAMLAAAPTPPSRAEVTGEMVEPIRRDLAVIIATLPHMGGNERSTHSLLERANSAVATLNALTKGTSE